MKKRGQSAGPGAAARPADVKRGMRRILAPHLRGAFAFGLALNLLLLVSPLYMMQVYDRVMVSGSTDTLIWISLIAVFLLLIYAAAESGRKTSLTAASEALIPKVSEWIFRRFNRESGNSEVSLTENFGRLARLEKLFSGGVFAPFLDLPFTPLFVAVLFLIHPVIGWVSVAGGVLVFLVALLAEMRTRSLTEESVNRSSAASQFASVIDRQRAAVISMGMAGALQAAHRALIDKAREAEVGASIREGTYSGFIKSLRQILQIAVLGVGAALALSQEVSAGAIVAASILMSRALGPIDQIVGAWTSFTRGREAWNALADDLAGHTERYALTPVQYVAPSLTIDRLAIAPPGTDRPLIHPFSMKAESGVLITLSGPIGSGKSTLLQTLAGVWPALDGEVALDGRNLATWPAEDRGRFIGYVPQPVELLPGTLKQNIARFGTASDEDILNALEAADAMDVVKRAPLGLDTPVGPSGIRLSAGQMQLIALARALLHAPPLLLLDEPTANLDPESSGRMVASLRRLAQNNTIVLVASHDLRLIQASHSLLTLANGAITRTTTQDFIEQVRRSNLKTAGGSET
jgi:PrtD family type I secretion system ABC transporter